MSEQRTLNRTLEMMVMLSQPGGHTIENMATYFDVHERTIRRTLDTISQAGYYLQQYRGRYFMDKEANARQAKFDVTNLLSFTRDEIWRLKAMFDKNIPSNRANDFLLSKIFGAIGLNNSAAKVLESHRYQLVEMIQKAIELKRQIKVKVYDWSSANRRLPDVILEPIDFALDHTRVWCYFPEMKTNVLARLTDLNNASLSEESMKHKDQHRTGFIDAFGASGFEKYPVTIHVNYRARGYLINEYAIPMGDIKPIIHRERPRISPYFPMFKFSTEVCGFFHIARFCMGLPGDVVIITPELHAYIDEVQSNSKTEEYEPSDVYMKI